MDGSRDLEIIHFEQTRDGGWARIRNRMAMLEQLELSGTHWEQMRAHVQACAPLEGCGLLLGRAETVVRTVPIGNATQSRSRFRMEPAEQLRAFRTMEEQGLDLVGIYHSHPAEPEGGAVHLDGPSETDVQEAAYPVVHVIWSRSSGEWRARGFWIQEGRISEVRLVVSTREQPLALTGS